MLRLETRWVVSLSTLLVLCVRRDADTALFVLGAVLNAVLSKVLKRCFNAARPAGAKLSDPGMPSSHAQSLFFFGGFLARAARHGPALAVAFSHASELALARYRAFLPLAALAVAAVLSLDRVRQGLHTLPQVAVGGLIGGIGGTLWHAHQPALSVALGGAAHPAAVGGLVACGTLVVASVERTLAAELKRRGAPAGDSGHRE